MNNKYLSLAIIFLLPLLIQCQQAPKQAQWRGPERNGIYPAKNLLTQWPEGGPELKWKFEGLGDGYSSAAVVEDRVYTTGAPDSIGYIYSFDLDGKLLWKKQYGPEWTTNFPGPRSTPVFYDGLGYVISGLGVVYCFDAENGNMVWTRDVFEMMDKKNIVYGITENLVVDGETIYCTPGGAEANVIAMNRMNGDILWKSKGNGEKSAYCSPILIERGGKKFFITSTAASVISIDTENGALAWKYDLKPKQVVHGNMPLYRDGYLFVMDGFEAGSLMLKVAEDGYSVSEVWKSDLLDETCGHSVLIGDNIYVSAESKEKFCCVDWNTGEIKYSIKRFSPGTVIAADGMLYCCSYFGDFGLVKPTTNGFEVKGEFKLKKKRNLHISHPVIKDGRMYVRYANQLLVYSIANV
jgi:outer membrane protein assembly factor BamB